MAGLCPQAQPDDTAPEFVRIVAELANRAGLPMPRVYLMDNPQPNAFATGRNPDHAAVAATTGLLNMLSRDELAGVISYELAHIRNAWQVTYRWSERANLRRSTPTDLLATRMQAGHLVVWFFRPKLLGGLR